MSHTVIAIFQSPSQAREVRHYLLANGFEDKEVDVSANAQESITSGGSSSGLGEDHSTDHSGGLINFFKDIFGDDDQDIRKHTEASKTGAIVTVHAKSRELAVTASEILDNYGAVDVNNYNPHQTFEDEEGKIGVKTERDQLEERNTDISETNMPNDDIQSDSEDVDTTSPKIRSRIIERPLDENIRLRSGNITTDGAGSKGNTSSER